MSINGANNNNFKVSTVGSGMPQDDWAAQETDPTAGMDDLFDMGSEGAGGAAGSDPFDGWMCGDTAGGVYVDGQEQSTQAWLSEFPPSLETVLARNENAVNYLDMVMNRYEKAREDLHALKQTYKQAIASGTCSNAELQSIHARMPLLDEALSRCEAEMEKCGDMAKEFAKTFIEEQRSMKDLNGDNWIGRPFVDESYYVQYNDDGTTTYIDPVSKKPVPCPILDPDYEAEIVSNDSLLVIDPTTDPDLTKVDMEQLGVTDVFLKLNDDALTNSNAFGCPIDIGIPESMWVEREDGTYKTDFDSELAEEKMVTFNSYNNSSGLKQNVPSDLSKYIQVKITRAKLYSIPCGTVDGDTVYSHVLEFYNRDDVLISRISIEGAETATPSSVATTMEKLDGTSCPLYIAASTVGVALHASNRLSPIELDCIAVESTGSHKFTGLEAQIGISADGSEKGDRAYNENVGLFTEHDYEYEKYVLDTDGLGGHWESVNCELDEGEYKYDGLNDRYLPPDKNVKVGEAPITTLKTGVFVEGLRGDIKLTRFCDVADIPGVNEYLNNDYAQEHLPEKLREVKKGDAFYSNFVDAGGGNDVVKVGKGNNYVLQATFVTTGGVKLNSNDELFVQFPDMPTVSAVDENSDVAPNQKTYLDVRGGHSYVYNPHEFSVNNVEDVTVEEQVEAANECYHDDYYKVLGGSVEFGFLWDDDVTTAIGATSGNGFNAGFITDAMSEPQSEWFDLLTGVPELGDVDTDIDWEEVMGAKTDLDSEMNGFFDEMFGDLNSFIGEYQESQTTGF